jgi:hypothetical protein
VQFLKLQLIRPTHELLHEKIAYASASNFSNNEQVLDDPHASRVSEVGEDPEVHETYETRILFENLFHSLLKPKRRENCVYKTLLSVSCDCPGCASCYPAIDHPVTNGAYTRMPP